MSIEIPKEIRTLPKPIFVLRIYIRPRIPGHTWTVRLPVVCAISDKLDYLVRYLNKNVQDGYMKYWFDVDGEDSVFTFDCTKYTEHRDDHVRSDVLTGWISNRPNPAIPNFPLCAYNDDIIETRNLPKQPQKNETKKKVETSKKNEAPKLEEQSQKNKRDQNRKKKK